MDKKSTEIVENKSSNKELHDQNMWSGLLQKDFNFSTNPLRRL